MGCKLSCRVGRALTATLDAAPRATRSRADDVIITFIVILVHPKERDDKGRTALPAQQNGHLP